MYSVNDYVLRWTKPVKCDRHALIMRIAYAQKDKEDTTINTFLNKVKHKDSSVSADLQKQNKSNVFEYRVLNSSGKELYYEDLISLFGREILKQYKINSRKTERRLRAINYNRKQKQYHYRKEPVPGVYKRGHFSTYYRLPKLGNVARQNSEYAEFEKPKYRSVNLPVWDDRPRHLDRSWKSSCHIKRQYMKHKGKHKDTCKSVKEQED
jgi:hypothetical protein